MFYPTQKKYLSEIVPNRGMEPTIFHIRNERSKPQSHRARSILKRTNLTYIPLTTLLGDEGFSLQPNLQKIIDFYQIPFKMIVEQWYLLIQRGLVSKTD